MKLFFRLASTVLLVAGIATSTGLRAQAVDPAALAMYDGADREQRLLEGARKENGLMIYTSLTVEDINAIAAAFEKKYGIKPKIWRAGSEKVVQRITTEARAGRFEYDVVDTNSPELEFLRREKLLQKAHSPYFADLIPQAVTSHREWVGTRLNMFVQMYNTNLVKKEDLPKSYQDLTNPKWKGRLGIETEDTDWFSTVVKDMGEEKGLKVFRDIVATNGMSVRKGHTLLAGLVASGEVPYALTVYSHGADKLKNKGAPVDWHMVPPGVVRVNGMALAKKPSHPHAAALFYDFMLSEGQAILARGDYLPSSRKAGSLADTKQFKFFDAAAFLDESEKWDKLYADIITKQSR
jgi:iron(III) transport system substrate-binding protein